MKPKLSPFYEGQEVRAEPIKYPGIIYGVVKAPNPAWPGFVVIVNDKYPYGTYCAIELIQGVEDA